jgi:hypothetical protein
MLAGTAYLAARTQHQIETDARADGVVIDLIVSRDSDSETYHPRVRFTTAKGQSLEFTSSVGSRPPGFDIGEHVTVLYDPADPEDASIDSFFQLWFGALILGVLGSVMVVGGGGVAVVLLRSARKPPQPMTQRESIAATSAVERRPRD